jgi:hypothetical protein
MTVVSITSGVLTAGAADENTPARIGSDAPHQERTSSDKPGVAALRLATFGAPRTTPLDSAQISPRSRGPQRRKRAGQAKAEGPVPSPIGSDAPHQERNSRPDLYALRLIVWER